MKPTLPSTPQRRCVIREQWWCGLALLLFWAAVIMGTFYGCAKAGEIVLTWDPAPPEEKVVAWKVYRGIDVFPAVTSPQIRISIPDDQPSVLTVRAENQFGDHSPPASIEVVPVIIESSTDLKTWTRVRTIYRARQTAEFFRIRIITP